MSINLKNNQSIVGTHASLMKLGTHAHNSMEIHFPTRCVSRGDQRVGSVGSRVVQRPLGVISTGHNFANTGRIPFKLGTRAYNSKDIIHFPTRCVSRGDQHVGSARQAARPPGRRASVQGDPAGTSPEATKSMGAGGTLPCSPLVNRNPLDLENIRLAPSHLHARQARRRPGQRAVV